MGDAWPDGGSRPPREGWYAEQAEAALDRGRDNPGIHASAQRELAVTFAMLEAAAALCRIVAALEGSQAREEQAWADRLAARERSG